MLAYRKKKKPFDERHAERMLKSLANRRRLLIVRYLVHTRSANVGNIATRINLSFKATSRHLGVLYAAGVLEREQAHIYMNYRLARFLDPIAKNIIDLL